MVRVARRHEAGAIRPAGAPRFDQRPRRVVAARFFILLAVALRSACFISWTAFAFRAWVIPV